MKKSVKILVIPVPAVICLLIVIISGALLYINTSHAARFLQETINNNIPGSLTWRKHHLSLLRGELDMRTIILHDAADQKIASIDRLFCNVSISSLLKKEVRITAFVCENPWIDLRMDTTGILNIVQAFSAGNTVQKEVVEQDTGNTLFNFHVDSLRLGQAAASFTAGDETFIVTTSGIELSAQGDMQNRKAAIRLGIDKAEIKGTGEVLHLRDLKITAALKGERVDSLVLSVTTPGSKLTLQANADRLFTNPQVSLDVSTDLALEEISSFFRLQPGLKGHVHAGITAGGTPGNPDADLHLVYGGGMLAGCEVDSIFLGCTISDRYARISSLHVECASGSVDLQGDADLRSAFPNGFSDSVIAMEALAYNTDLAVEHLDVTRLPWITTLNSGIVTSRATITGKGITPKHITAEGEVDLTVSNLQTGGLPSPIEAGLKTNVFWSEGTLQLKRMVLKTRNTQLAVLGSYDINRQKIDASLKLDTTDLGGILPLFGVDSIRGFAALEGTISGAIQNPSAQCRLIGYDCVYPAHRVGDITLHASLDEQGTITCSKFNLRNKNSNLSLTGTVDLFKTGSMKVRKEPAMQVTIADTRLFLQDFLDSLSGEVSLDARVQGVPAALYGAVFIAGNGIDLGVQRLHGVTLKAELDSQRIHLVPLEVAVTPEERILARGWIGMDKRYDLSLSTAGISLASLNRLAERNTLDGLLSFNFNGSGILDTPSVTGEISLQNILIQEKPFEDILVDVNLQNQRAEVSGKLNFDIQGWYHFAEKDFSAAVLFNQTDLTPYFRLADQKELTGSITGTVEASGNVDSIKTDGIKKVDVLSAITHLVVYHKALNALETDNITASLEGNVIAVSPVRISLLNEGNIDISGRGALDGTVDFILNANIPVDLVGLFSSDLTDADGTVEITGTLNGDIKDPNIKADIVLNDISVTVPELMQKVYGVNGYASLTPQRITIDSIAGWLDEGRFSCEGTVDLDSLKPSDFSIALQANTLPLNIPDALDLQLNADMRFQGTPDSSVIAGTVEMVEGIYYKDIRMLSGVGQRKREISPEPMDRGESFFSNLNFDVIVAGRENFVVDNNIAQLQIEPDLRLVGTMDKPMINGRATVASGTVSYLRNTFTVQRGVLDFVDPYKIDPVVDIKAVTKKREWNITLTISGSLNDLIFTVSSVPELEHEDIVSLLVVNKTTYELSRGELMSGGSTEQLLDFIIEASNIGKTIRDATGLEVFSVDAGSKSQRFTVGKALTKRLMTTLAIESEKGDLTRKAIIEYKILDNILLQAYNDDKGNYGGEIHFIVEFR